MPAAFVSPSRTGWASSLFQAIEPRRDPGPTLGQAIEKTAKHAGPKEVFWIYLFVTPLDDHVEDSLFPKSTVYSPGNVDRLYINSRQWRGAIGKTSDDFRDALRRLHAALRDRPVAFFTGTGRSDVATTMRPIAPVGAVHYVHISSCLDENSLAFLKEAGIWLACRDWNTLRTTLYWPLRSLLTETVAALAFAAFRATVHHHDSQQVANDRNREIAVNTTDLVPHLRSLVYLIDRAKSSHTTVDQKTQYMMNSTILERLRLPACHIPPRDERFVREYTYKHAWVPQMVNGPADLSSLANQVAHLILEYRGLKSDGKPLDDLRKAKCIEVFEALDPCFGVLMESDCETNLKHRHALLDVFDTLKDVFHRTFTRQERELPYTALALWCIEKGISEGVEKLRKHFRKVMTGVPLDVLTLLDAWFNEIYFGGPMKEDASLRIDEESESESPLHMAGVAIHLLRP